MAGSERSPSVERYAEQAEKFLSHRFARRAATQPETRRDRVAVFPEQTPEEDLLALAAAQQFRAERAAAGFCWPDGAPAYGGQGLTRAHAEAYERVEARYAVPANDIFAITDGMVVPAILGFGNESAKRTFLPRLVGGELVGCQLFSEPGAGSDLGALSTRAERDGDSWIVNGQKVWSSGAHLAQVGLLLARPITSSNRRDMVMLLVDMGAPGVTVRPLRQMTGGSSFNEVFFDDVQVGDDRRLGEPGEGWAVAMATLQNERAMAGDLGWLTSGLMEQLVLLATEEGCNGAMRDRVIDVFVRGRLIDITVQRVSSQPNRANPAGSVVKLSMSDNATRIASVASSLLGPKILADGGGPGTYSWSELVLSAPALRIAGGTDEIQRNTIAERVLGLPKS
jgi:alkylation response protein AidB-like acyl-CoA dehydrogenase